MTSCRLVLAVAIAGHVALCGGCSGVSPGSSAPTSSASTTPAEPNAASGGPNATAPPTAADDRSTAGTTTELRLSGGDKVRVTVYGEDKISGEYQIDGGGFLSIPLAGTVHGAGLTKIELEQALTQKLKSEYLRNPKVTVEVISYRPFYVLGEVKSPGEYQFRSGLNVLSAIAIAGGATYRANNSTVMIQRFGSTELKDYPQSPTVLVLPGDVVRVPERFF
jgi:protein involved in polysaccharide export with SLBB domain